MYRDGAELFAVVELQATVRHSTKIMRLFEDRLEDGLEFAGRRIDNP
jgi:hypothetical protein